MTLKSKLIDHLQSWGRLDLNQLQKLCNDYPAKISSAEKRLREMREPLHSSYLPEVGVEMKSGYINAYVWKPIKQIDTFTYQQSVFGKINQTLPTSISTGQVIN